MRNRIPYLKSFEKKVYKYRRYRNVRIRRRKGDMFVKKSPLPKFIFPLSFKIFLKKKDGIPTKGHNIEIPVQFCFCKNFDETVIFFRKLVTYFLKKKSYVTIDFSECEYISNGAMSLLKFLVEEFKLFQKRYQKSSPFYNIRQIKFIPSFKNQKVKKHIQVMDFCDYTDFEDEDGEVLSMNLIKGKYKSSYQENIKGKAIKQIVDFINESFRPVNKELSEEGLNNIESLVSEILNNSEDHSYRNCEWYTNGVAFHETIDEINVVELNLSIVNFGNSMFEGFEETKKLNSEHYEMVNEKYERHAKLFDRYNWFSKESLFMLYMLNEGISRLKYEDASRGNGTMQFLDAFATFGSFGTINENFNSQLNVISGHTVVTCDNRVAPYQEGNHLKLSLNQEKDLSLLPEKKYLKHNTEYFPGTIIECKIYLNERFFNDILSNEQ